MRLNDAREEYVRWLLATRDLSPHTVRAYRGDLASFEGFAGASRDINELDQSILLDFLESQRAASLSPASLRRRAAALRGFSRWLVGQGWVEEDPWLGARVAAGRGRRLPRTLPAADLDRLLSFLKRAAGVEDASPEVSLLRERPHEATTLLAVMLMVSTGVRVHEAIGLRCRDIDLASRSVRLVGKGRRERQVFLTNDWIAALTEAYLELRDTLRLTHSRLLFNLQHEPLTTAAMRSRLDRAARAAGVANRVTPHMLRHTAATQLIEAGVDIRYIQRLLGHASLSTTEIYTHVSDHALKRVISEADVLGRLTQAR